MNITFDPAKPDKTCRSGTWTSPTLRKVFEGPVFTAKDERQDYPGERFVTAGSLPGRMVVVVWTPTADGRRIISMRKADDREQRKHRGQPG